MNQFGLLLKLTLGGGIEKFALEIVKQTAYNIFIEWENNAHSINEEK